MREFLQAMSGISRASNIAIAQKFPWSRYRTFVDAGTAQGDLAVQIALAHRHLTGMGLDLPLVGPCFKEYIAAHKLESRVSFHPGDFFADPLPKADVLLFGHVLHNWDLPQKKQLLRKAYQAVPDGGAVVVYEPVIDEARTANVFGLLMSLNMLLETEGGFDFTASECKGWMEEAGFGDVRTVHLQGPDSMVYGTK